MKEQAHEQVHEIEQTHERANAHTLIEFKNVGKVYHTGDLVYEALHDVN